MESVKEKLSKQLRLLQMEYDYERAEYERALHSGHVQYPTYESGCRYPVRIDGTSRDAMGRSVLRVAFEREADEGELDFEPGRTAVFFRLTDDGSSVVELQQPCHVSMVGDDWVEVQMPSAASARSIESYARLSLIGLQLCIDDTSFRVMQDALRRAMESSDEPFNRLRDVLLGENRPRFRELPQQSFPWLNESQNEAVNRAVAARDVAVVHGPPGTGKTTTLIECISETLRHEPQVMVCAASNAAVDWLCTQLMHRGISVLRVGNPLRVSDEMLACCYERRFADHPDYHELWNLRRHVLKTKSSSQRRTDLNRRIAELEYTIRRDVLNQAGVVACTLVGSGYAMLNGLRVNTLFVDEAAQAMEAACWSALLKCRRVVFGGDHKQLPPVVKCVEAAREGLGQTLMQRLVGSKPECVTLLTTQYRMNEAIMGFSSRWFYGGKLHADASVAHRLVSPIDTPLTWFDTRLLGYDERAGSRGPSLSNVDEARMVMRLVREYVEMIGESHIVDHRVDFGIIAPYRAQVRLLRRLLRMQHFFRSLRRQVSVDTVDGFQGQERDVVLLSMVRSNADGTIGFLSDQRRMNVAITRARMKLMIVGNSETLSHHAFFRALLDYVEQHGELVVLQPPEIEQ